MAMNRAALDKFLENRKPYIEDIIGMGFQEHQMIYPQFLNMRTAKTGWVDMATISGMGLWAVKDELADAQEDDVIQGPVARAKVLTYAQRHEVSQEAIEDEQGDGIIANRVPAIARAGRATMEVLGHDILNGGFASVYTPDGVVLFSDSHVNLAGTNYSNLLSAADISQAGLQAAILAIENMTDDRNIPIVQVAKKIIIHPASKWATQVILGSAQVVGSPNNDMNPMFTQGLTTLESPFVTDDDSWFVQADQHHLNWFTRIAPENWSKVNEVASSVMVGARFRCATAAWDPRGIVGSAGGA